MRLQKNQLVTVGLLLAVVIPFCGWLLRAVNLDFWYDEIVTLRDSVFVPLARIPTTYTSPNNHIFFNLVNHLYLTALGIRDLPALMAQPAAIRALMAVYALLTLAALGWLGYRFFNTRVALLALLGLVTTVPYLNLALQVRGYGLSLLWVVLVFYGLLAIEQKLTWINGGGLVLFTALLLYTLPSNLYLVGSLLLYFGLAWAAPLAAGYFRRPKEISFSIWLKTAPVNSHALQAALLLAAGVALAGLAYLPVLGDVFRTARTEGVGLDSVKTHLLLAPRTLDYFISFRYPWLLLAIAGLAVLYRSKQSAVFARCAFFLFVLLAPFAANLALWSQPVDRVFTGLLIPFVLFLALALDALIAAVPWLRLRPALTLVLVILYAQVTFAFALQNRDGALLADIHHAQAAQNVFYNYYLAYYQPARAAALYEAADPDGTLYVYQYGDNVAVPAYIAAAGIRAIKVDATSQIPLTGARATFVLTAFPDLFDQKIHKSYPAADCKLAQPDVGFVNLFFCTLSP